MVAGFSADRQREEHQAGLAVSRANGESFLAECGVPLVDMGATNRQWSYSSAACWEQRRRQLILPGLM
jgi:hypothetical protein